MSQKFYFFNNYLKFLYFFITVFLIGLLFTPLRLLGFIYFVQILMALGLMKIFGIHLLTELRFPSLKLSFFTAVVSFVLFFLLKLFPIWVPPFFHSPIVFFQLLILAPFVEELFFRQALLMSILEFGFPAKISIFISSVLFGAFHLLALLQTSFYKPFIILQSIFAVGVGVLLSLSFLKSKSLITPICLHIIINGTFLIFISLF